MSPPGHRPKVAVATLERPEAPRTCCPNFHQAVELVGKRWTGAILLVLVDGPAHFSEIRALVPEISDRLLSERLKELDGEGIVDRSVIDDTPVRVEYALTDKGRALLPILDGMREFGREWLAGDRAATAAAA